MFLIYRRLLQLPRCESISQMQTVTLEDLHRDPTILDRALKGREVVEILDGERVAGKLIPQDVGGELVRSERGFPISRGRAPFGTAEVAQIEREAAAL